MNMRNTLYKMRKKIASVKVIDRIAKKPYMKIQKIIFCNEAMKVLRQIDKKRTEKNIWFLDVPTHPNLGDIAQYWCIRKWIEKNYPDYELFEISAQTICYAEEKFLSVMQKKCSADDIIIFQSGYCTQDLGGMHDYIHRLVVKNNKITPIVMMPQTILYKNKENELRTSKIYSENRNLFILCRDNISYETAKRIFPSNYIMAFPDIVTSLIGTIDVLPENERKGILICARNDSEKYYSDREIESLVSQLEGIDSVEISDTTIKCDYSQIKNHIEEYVMDMIKKFMGYKVIITDRYHGTIFSIIAGTPVIVIKSNDHKVVTGVDWFKGIYDGKVRLVDNLNLIPDIVSTIEKNYLYQKPEDYFNKQYYSMLKNIVEQWRAELVGCQEDNSSDENRKNQERIS